MDGDLPQRNLVNGIDPDFPRLGDDFLVDLNHLLTSLTEQLTSSNQIGGDIRFSDMRPLQLPQPRPSLQLPQPRPSLQLLSPSLQHFFNRAPASDPMIGGELLSGDILQLSDGGVGRGDRIGNGLGANDQGSSSDSINDIELGATYVRASDYFRHVRTENGEVHFHMNPFVYLGGRVYNIALEPHLNNLGASQLISKAMLAITGQTGIALMVAALNDHSSPFPPAFFVVVAANIVGFIAIMISMLLRTRKPWASRVLAKVGAVAASSAIILAMGMALHMRHIWAFLFLCIIAAAAVLFGQT